MHMSHLCLHCAKNEKWVSVFVNKTTPTGLDHLDLCSFDCLSVTSVFKKAGLKIHLNGKPQDGCHGFLRETFSIVAFKCEA